MRKLWICCGVASVLMFSGCGKKEESENVAPKEEATKTAAGAPAGIDEANGATVTGKISFAGEKPAMRNIDMSANPVCARAHTTPQKSEEVVVNGNGTLKNVFVWVKSGLPDRQWSPPTGAVELDQEGCMYKPHVLAVMAGENIRIRNSDGTNHNIHPMPRINQEWNESQPPKGEDKLKSFAREEIMIPVKCNVHPWMRSYINVVGHPFYAVTGDDGTFTIKGLPPGKYVIQAVHEKFGNMEQEVTVAPKESKTVDFSYKG